MAMHISEVGVTLAEIIWGSEMFRCVFIAYISEIYNF